MNTTTETGLTQADLERWIIDFARRIIDQHEALSDLDAASGDADHGSNMERGMSSLLETLGDWEATDQPGEFLKQVGMHIVGSVGGSSGALYGTMFLRMARAVGDATTVADDQLVAAFEGAAQGIVDRGKVKPGDKTMLDALAPAVETLRQELAAGASRSSALMAASAAADAGRDATADMVARRGKSSYARERSRGFVDPGSASVALLVRAAAQNL
jgi:dihydroxyacetone kinase-like protein